MANTFDPVWRLVGDGEQDEDDHEDSHTEKGNGHNQFIMRKAKIRRIVNNMRLVMRKISISAMAIYTVFISCSNRGVVGEGECNSLKEWIFPHSTHYHLHPTPILLQCDVLCICLPAIYFWDAHIRHTSSQVIVQVRTNIYTPPFRCLHNWSIPRIDHQPFIILFSRHSLGTIGWPKLDEFSQKLQTPSPSHWKRQWLLGEPQQQLVKLGPTGLTPKQWTSAYWSERQAGAKKRRGSIGSSLIRILQFRPRRTSAALHKHLKSILKEATLKWELALLLVSNLLSSWQISTFLVGQENVCHQDNGEWRMEMAQQPPDIPLLHYRLWIFSL